MSDQEPTNIKTHTHTQKTQKMSTLKATIAQYIKEVKKKGTVKMSLENLFMCCPVAPIAYSEMAGTNGRYVYKQEFFKTAAKHFPSFII